MREEVYENSWDILNHPGFRDVYYDDRRLAIVKEISWSRNTGIVIGVKGFTYTKPPAIKDQGPPMHTPTLELEIKENEIYYGQ